MTSSILTITLNLVLLAAHAATENFNSPTVVAIPTYDPYDAQKQGERQYSPVAKPQYIDAALIREQGYVWDLFT